MKLRPLCERDDLAAVGRIYLRSWQYAYRGLLPDAYLDSLTEERWAENLLLPGRRSLLLLDGETPAGTASYGPSRFPEWQGYGELISLYLLPEYIGRGYGRQLFAAAERGLLELGFTRFFLWVLEGNVRARRFYERMGLRPSGVSRTDVIGGREVREFALSGETRAEKLECPMKREPRRS